MPSTKCTTRAVRARLAGKAALLGVALSACAAPNTIAQMTTRPADPAANLSATRASPVIELRQYTLHPGRRDDLIRLFDAEFIEPQESAGITVIGQFRTLDDPNKFVWLRGFPDMESRRRSLQTFYTGTAWRSRRTDANATIIDNDNVLLLRPANADAGFDLTGLQRPPVGATSAGNGLVVATIYHLDPTAEKEREFVHFFDASVLPILRSAGAEVIATLLPEPSANTFPGLPVREGEHVFIWFSRFPDVAAHERFLATLAATPIWRDSLSVELSSRVREPFTLRLSPTARSLIHD